MAGGLVVHVGELGSLTKKPCMVLKDRTMIIAPRGLRYCTIQKSTSDPHSLSRNAKRSTVSASCRKA